MQAMLGFMYKAEAGGFCVIARVARGSPPCVVSSVVTETLAVHQKPVVLPPGGILTLTELRLGEFLTETAGSKSGPGSGC